MQVCVDVAEDLKPEEWNPYLIDFPKSRLLVE